MVVALFRTLEFKKSQLPILISIDGSLVLPKAFPIDKEKPCSCTTCIVYVNLFKDRFFLKNAPFQKRMQR